MGDMERDCTRCGVILTEHIAMVTCGNSCKECGKYSYAADEPSYLYLLTNVQLKLHKIGIGTVGQDKNYLQQLTQAGWNIHGLWHAGDKEKTFKWERAVFSQLKEQFDSGDAGAPGLLGRGRWARYASPGGAPLGLRLCDGPVPMQPPSPTQFVGEGRGGGRPARAESSRLAPRTPPHRSIVITTPAFPLIAPSVITAPSSSPPPSSRCHPTGSAGAGSRFRRAGCCRGSPAER